MSNTAKRAYLDLIFKNVIESVNASKGLITVADVWRWILYRLVQSDERTMCLETLASKSEDVSDEERDDMASFTMEDAKEAQVDAAMDDPVDIYVEDVYPLGEEIDPDYLKPLVQQPDYLKEMGYEAPAEKAGT